METVNVTISVPKEGKEIFDAVAGIIAHFKAGKGIDEALVLLQPVLTAVDGVDALGDELSSQGLDELAGYGVHKIIESLRG